MSYEFIFPKKYFIYLRFFDVKQYFISMRSLEIVQSFPILPANERFDIDSTGVLWLADR